MLRWAWLIPVCCLIACVGQPVRAPVGDHSSRPAGNPAHHVVRKGDTLYSVAFMYGYSVEEVATWNGLRSPYTIYKGQKLRLRPSTRATATSTRQATQVRASQPKPSRPKIGQPAASQPKTSQVKASQPKTSQPRTRQAKAGQPKASQPKTSQPKPGSPQKAATVAATAASGERSEQPRFSSHVIWSWPVKGKLIQGFNANSVGKKGVKIAARDGTSVRAAASGKVVYAGSGLSGYGRLIIIKHNKDFLSAYAHNRKLVATEGQWVNKGEVIAQMGSSGTDRTQLHFEIRKRGQPVDPLRYLPKR